MMQRRTTPFSYIEYSDAARLNPWVAVSVIIPTYRHAAFIRATLDGIISQQTDFPFEVLVGEDFSPDDTLTILKELQLRYPRALRILSFPANVGPHANMKALVDASRAPLIAHCDGDDQWTDPYKLAIQHQLFIQNPAAKLIYHAAGTIDAKGYRQRHRIRRGLFSRVVSAREVILGDGGMIPTSSIMADKSVMSSEPAWQREAPIGDYPLAIRASINGDVIYIDREMCNYRVNVPHSWTERYLPVFEMRLDYARRIDTMLTELFLSHPEYACASRAVISKYYSDVLIQHFAETPDTIKIYKELCDRMQGYERALAWLAVYRGIHLPWLKDFLRKIRTFCRLVIGHIVTRRIVLGSAAQEKRL